MYTQEETEAWIKEFFDAFDALDASRMPSIFSKDAFGKIANEPELKGLEAIQRHVTGMFSLLQSQSHKVLRVDTVRDGTAIYTALEITFTFKSHPEEPVVIPSLSYFERVPKGKEEAGKVKTLMIYEDLAPVKAKLGAH
ncbi:hypothetical protein N431DRAFT_503957 [Stipitochalara longipes BDJ]|nr:hypothetical protein N431DRAFT_503957 [Stipitochalara longipes BDJ]